MPQLRFALLSTYPMKPLVTLVLLAAATLHAQVPQIINYQGRIAVGYDADLTVVDLKRQETITDRWIESRCGWTPYDGVRVQGWPVGTFVRGRRVMWQGEIGGPAQGEPVRFVEGG